jgi:hypothetical protein
MTPLEILIAARELLSVPERRGQLFHVLVRGKLNSCLIRFVDDGWTVVTSRNALRRA